MDSVNNNNKKRRDQETTALRKKAERWGEEQCRNDRRNKQGLTMGKREGQNSPLAVVEK